MFLLFLLLAPKWPPAPKKHVKRCRLGFFSPSRSSEAALASSSSGSPRLPRAGAGQARPKFDPSATRPAKSLFKPEADGKAKRLKVSATKAPAAPTSASGGSDDDPPADAPAVNWDEFDSDVDGAAVAGWATRHGRPPVRSKSATSFKFVYYQPETARFAVKLKTGQVLSACVHFDSLPAAVWYAAGLSRSQLGQGLVHTASRTVVEVSLPALATSLEEAQRLSEDFGRPILLSESNQTGLRCVSACARSGRGFEWKVGEMRSKIFDDGFNAALDLSYNEEAYLDAAETVEKEQARLDGSTILLGSGKIGRVKIDDLISLLPLLTPSALLPYIRIGDARTNDFMLNKMLGGLDIFVAAWRRVSCNGWDARGIGYGADASWLVWIQ